MSIKDETLLLLAKKILPHFDSKNYVDWALCIIENGTECENLYILAGLDNEEREIREKYFAKVIKELNIDINLSDFLLLENYAKFVAENVISGKLSQSKGLIEMNKIVVKSDYDIKYFDFFQLDEDLDYLKYSESTISNYELSKDNKEEFILEEFRLFLEIEKLKVREEIREYSICAKCNHIGKPKLKTEYQLKSPIKYKIWKCEKCNSKEIEHFNSQSGKRKIINKIKNIC